MRVSFMPCKKKVGHFILEMFYLLLYVSLAKNWPRKPMNYLAKAFMLLKELMRAKAPGRTLLTSSSAIPVPIDLPITIMLFSLKPSLLTK